MRGVVRNVSHPLNDPPRSLTTTLAPRAPKNKAYAFPKPPLAPVTTTVCPSNRISDILIVQGQCLKNEGKEEIRMDRIQRALFLPYLGTGLRFHFSEYFKIQSSRGSIGGRDPWLGPSISRREEEKLFNQMNFYRLVQENGHTKYIIQDV